MYKAVKSKKRGVFLSMSNVDMSSLRAGYTQHKMKSVVVCNPLRGQLPKAKTIFLAFQGSVSHQVRLVYFRG